jgi:hypothetical protein
MMELKPGDFIFFRTYSLSGYFIKWFQSRLFGKQWSDVTHVAVCVQSPDVVREAVIPRVTIQEYTRIKDRDVVVIVRPKFIQPEPRLYVEMNKQQSISGQVYGVQQILGLVVYSIAAVWGHRPKQNPIHAGRICTEDAYFFKKDMERTFGINENDNLQKDTIFPAELLGAFERSENYFLITNLA